MWRPKRRPIKNHQASKRLLPPLPSTVLFVYKYRTVDHLKWLDELVLGNELYFPTAHELKLNDPKEANPRLAKPSAADLVSKMTSLSAAQKSAPQMPYYTTRARLRDAAILRYNLPRLGVEAVMASFEPALNSQLDGFRIYSLSKRGDSEYLWNEYGGRHTGYCLEFRNEPPFGPIFDVRYVEPAIDITDSDPTKPDFLFYKRPAWRREEEVRMIGGLKSPCHVPFDPARLTRIILGKHISAEHEAVIRTLADRRTTPLEVVHASSARAAA